MREPREAEDQRKQTETEEIGEVLLTPSPSVLTRHRPVHGSALPGVGEREDGNGESDHENEVPTSAHVQVSFARRVPYAAGDFKKVASPYFLNRL